MKPHEFADGIAKLKVFFPKLKPSGELLEEWYKLLGGYHCKAWKEAVDWICLTVGHTPSFPEIIGVVRQKQAKYSAGDFWVCDSGAAPMTDELRSFCKGMMGELYRAMVDGKVKERKDDMIEMWHSGFQKLPSYKTAAEVRKMADQDRFDELLDLSVIEGKYIRGQGRVGYQGLR